MHALRRKEHAWETARTEYLRKTPREKWSVDDIECDGLTEEEDAEYRQLQKMRYREWLLTDNPREDARFEKLQRLDDEWRQRREARLEPQEVSDDTVMDINEECKELHRQFRHEMSEKEWSDYQKLLHKRKMRMWLDFLGGNEDFDWKYLLQLLQFKIDRFADYWGRFALVENSEYYRKRMQLASRLLQIVLNRGNESGDYDKFPYRVNIRNKERFKVYHNPYAHNPCNKQDVRFNKAYCLFFKLLQKDLLSWWY